MLHRKKNIHTIYYNQATEEELLQLVTRHPPKEISVSMITGSLTFNLDFCRNVCMSLEALCIDHEYRQ